MRFYTLKEHFELRNSRSLSGRQGVGRFFRYKDYPGFTDGSGAVWPVLIADNLSLEDLIEGAIYSFKVSGIQKTQGQTSKYRDKETFLSLSHMSYESGANSSQWSICSVCDPMSLPLFSGNEEPRLGTAFAETLTSQRLQLLNHRAEAIKRARNFFCYSGYLDLDAPQLVVSGGHERYLKTFRTQYEDHRGQIWPMELPTSPEFSLKKIVAEGASRVFSLTHAFRNNGELSVHHDPEFMMLEWYRTGGTLSSLMTETQKLIEEVSSVVQGALVLPAGQWPVFTVAELFQSLLKIDLAVTQDVDDFRKVGMTKCTSVVTSDSWDDVFCKLFMEFVEPFLASQKACFVTEYPEQMGALAAKTEGRSAFVDRFEAYLDGVEICNGYRELLDETDFLTRRRSIEAQRPDLFIDPQFDCIMNVGLYPCVGNALGFDRLIAVLLRQKHIQAILPWPFASRFSAATIALE
jgi:lysyl-tRNA synthetase class 2